jgi:hypothetical protein
MRPVIIALLFFVFFKGFSQNLDNLDEKYGFNKFKLESPIQNYIKDCKYMFTSKKTGNVLYKYIRKDIDVFGIEIESLVLVFHKNKLYTIEIKVNPANDSIYGKITSELAKLFGSLFEVAIEKDYGVNDSRTYLESQIRWETNKTLLGLDEIKCNSPLDPCKITIWLESKIIRKQVNNDGF